MHHDGFTPAAAAGRPGPTTGGATQTHAKTAAPRSRRPALLVNAGAAGRAAARRFRRASGGVNVVALPSGVIRKSGFVRGRARVRRRVCERCSLRLELQRRRSFCSLMIFGWRSQARATRGARGQRGAGAAAGSERRRALRGETYNEWHTRPRVPLGGQRRLRSVLSTAPRAGRQAMGMQRGYGARARWKAGARGRAGELLPPGRARVLRNQQRIF